MQKVFLTIKGMMTHAYSQKKSSGAFGKLTHVYIFSHVWCTTSYVRAVKWAYIFSHVWCTTSYVRAVKWAYIFSHVWCTTSYVRAVKWVIFLTMFGAQPLMLGAQPLMLGL